MGNEADAATDISHKLPGVKSGSLVVYGDIFGGRIDNIHVITAAEVSPDRPERLIIHFNEGETLTVWDPGHATISANEFRIADASRVRWEWYYYGRPRTDTNRYFIEHVRTGDSVVVTTDVDWAPSQFKPIATRPAVELLGMPRQ